MSHKLTLRTLTLNKEGVKKGTENIVGGQECKFGDLFLPATLTRTRDLYPRVATRDIQTYSLAKV